MPPRGWRGGWDPALASRQGASTGARRVGPRLTPLPMVSSEVVPHEDRQTQDHAQPAAGSAGRGRPVLSTGVGAGGGCLEDDLADPGLAARGLACRASIGRGKRGCYRVCTLPQTPGTTTLVGPSPVSRRPGCQEAPDPWTMAIGQGTHPRCLHLHGIPATCQKITK